MINHFFDIGAHTGNTFTDFLSKTEEHDGWSVWCFEPSPRHIPKLMEVASLYKDRYQIHICPFGISQYDSLSVFHQKDDPMGDSFESHLASDHQTYNLETGYILAVPTFSLQRICALLPTEDSIVAKLDCEGAEYGILESLAIDTPPHLKKLLVEWHTIGSPHDTPENLIAKQKIPVEGWYL